MIGVDYDLFWVLDPKSLAPFVNAFNLRRKYDDFMMWQSGVYIKMAITSAFNKQSRYPERPLLNNIGDDGLTQAERIKEKFKERMIVLNARFKKEDSSE